MMKDPRIGRIPRRQMLRGSKPKLPSLRSGSVDRIQFEKMAVLLPALREHLTVTPFGIV